MLFRGYINLARFYGELGGPPSNREEPQRSIVRGGKFPARRSFPLS